MPTQRCKSKHMCADSHTYLNGLALIVAGSSSPLPRPESVLPRVSVLAVVAAGARCRPSVAAASAFCFRCGCCFSCGCGVGCLSCCRCCSLLLRCCCSVAVLVVSASAASLLGLFCALLPFLPSCLCCLAAFLLSLGLGGCPPASGFSCPPHPVEESL